MWYQPASSGGWSQPPPNNNNWGNPNPPVQAPINNFSAGSNQGPVPFGRQPGESVPVVTTTTTTRNNAGPQESIPSGWNTLPSTMASSKPAAPQAESWLNQPGAKRAAAPAPQRGPAGPIATQTGAAPVRWGEEPVAKELPPLSIFNPRTTKAAPRQGEPVKNIVPPEVATTNSAAVATTNSAAVATTNSAAVATTTSAAVATTNSAAVATTTSAAVVATATSPAKCDMLDWVMVCPDTILPFSMKLPVLRELGSGTFGRVASYLINGREYAVKISSNTLVLEDGMDGYLINEISILKVLEHPNIMKVLSAGFTEDTTSNPGVATGIASLLKPKTTNPNITSYMIMPKGYGTLLDAIDWFSVLVPNLEDRAVSIFAGRATFMQTVYELVSGVAYLHSNGIIHRDLKTPNIISGLDGHFKIADFGSSKTFFCAKGPLLDTNVTTQWYRAPEIFYGDNNYDETIDNWSLGCIIYEMYKTVALFASPNGVKAISPSMTAAEKAEITANRENKRLGLPTTDDVTHIRMIYGRVGTGERPTLAKLPHAKYFDVNVIPDQDARGWSTVPHEGLRSLLGHLIILNPRRRPSLKWIMAQDYFAEVRAQLFMSESQTEANLSIAATVPATSCLAQLERRSFPFTAVDETLSAYEYRAIALTKNYMLLFADRPLGPGAITTDVYMYAIDLFHTLLSSKYLVESRQYMLVSLACLWISSVYLEQGTARIQDQGQPIKPVEVENEGRKILAHISFDVMRATAYHFYRVLVSGPPANPVKMIPGTMIDNVTLSRRGYLIIQLISLSDNYMRMTALEVAEMAIYIENRIGGAKDPLPDNLVDHYAQFRNELNRGYNDDYLYYHVAPPNDPIQVPGIEWKQVLKAL